MSTPTSSLHGALGALFLVLGLLTVASAQTSPTPVDPFLALGTLRSVAVLDDAGRWTSGRVVRVTSSSLTLRSEGREVTIDRPEIVQVFEVGDSISNGLGIGFGLGAVVGAIVGGGADVCQGRTGDTTCTSSQRFTNGSTAAAVLGTLGLGIGTLLDVAISGRTLRYAAQAGDTAAAAIRRAGRTSAPPRVPPRRWTVSVVTGAPSHAPANAMERAMSDAAFNGRAGGCFLDLCFGTFSTPYSTSGRVFRDSWFFTAHARVRSRLGVGVTRGHTLVGWTTGSHRVSGAYLETQTSISHVAATATFTPTPGVRLGAGPGLFSTTVNATGLVTGELGTTRRPGLLGELSLTVPRRSRLFVEVSFQQRWFGRADVGPFDVRADGSAHFPQSAVPMSHWFLGLGTGLRF